MATGRVPTTANSPLTAKGDLFGYSTTQARVAVGNDGETLVADSSTSTGLRYQVGNGIAQGVINGGMDIWQRSTSSASNGITTADRFYCSSSGACTFSQDSTYVPDGIRYALKGLAGATTNIQYLQAIETANSIPFANKTVTLSAYVAASTSTAVELVLAYSTSTDVGVAGSWTNITATSGGTGTATTSVSRVSGVFAVPSTAKSLRLLVGTSSTVANGVAFYATGIQLEIGSVATNFRRAGGTIQGELAACQRYYEPMDIVGSATTATGQCTSTTGASASFTFKVVKRVAPTITLATSGKGAGQASFLTANGTFATTVGTIAVGSISTYGFDFAGASYGASTFVAGNAALYYGNGAQTIYTASAEL